MSGFQLSDLTELTFRPIDSNTSISVADATPEQFGAYIRQQVSGLRNVDPDWPESHRLHILNTIYTECRERFLVFPFAGCYFKEKQ